MKTGEIVFLAVAATIVTIGIVATLATSGPIVRRPASPRWINLGAALQAAFGRVGGFYVVAVFCGVPIIFLTAPTL